MWPHLDPAMNSRHNRTVRGSAEGRGDRVGSGLWLPLGINDWRLRAVGMKVWILAALVACIAAGCGEGEDDSPQGEDYRPQAEDYRPQAGDAAGECETLFSTFCGRLNECLNINEQDCLTRFRTRINCGDAFAVDDDYDRCLEEIRTFTCNGFSEEDYALPASCIGAIKVVQ